MLQPSPALSAASTLEDRIDPVETDSAPVVATIESAAETVPALADAAPAVVTEPEPVTVAVAPILETPVVVRAIEDVAEPMVTPIAPSPMEPPLRAGDRLRLSREHRTMSLEQASAQLRIRKDYLAALEDMNVKLLPGKAYAIPYLRSYARLLAIDADALVTQFQAESALSREDATPQIRNPNSKPRQERPWIWAAALGVMAAGFVVYRTLIHTDHTVVATPEQTAVAAAPKAVAPTVEGDGLPFGVAAQRIEIRALSAGWLNVRTPGGTIMLDQELAAGQVYQPDTGAGWTLHARDGGAFEVFVNGASAGLLGALGAPVLGRQVDAIAAAAMKAEATGAPAPVGVVTPLPTTAGPSAAPKVVRPPAAKAERPKLVAEPPPPAGAPLVAPSAPVSDSGGGQPGPPAAP